MQASQSKRPVGCIGKCTSGLNSEELDQITDNILKTLAHPKGRQIFRTYLRQSCQRDNLACLEFYDTCCEIIERDRNYVQTTNEPSVETLMDDVEEAKIIAEDLDGVAQIDMTLLELYNLALSTESRPLMLRVLEQTKSCLRDHLRRAHENFKRYASEPCPMTRS